MNQAAARPHTKLISKHLIDIKAKLKKCRFRSICNLVLTMFKLKIKSLIMFFSLFTPISAYLLASDGGSYDGYITRNSLYPATSPYAAAYGSAYPYEYGHYPYTDPILGRRGVPPAVLLREPGLHESSKLFPREISSHWIND